MTGQGCGTFPNWRAVEKDFQSKKAKKNFQSKKTKKSPKKGIAITADEPSAFLMNIASGTLTLPVATDPQRINIH